MSDEKLISQLVLCRAKHQLSLQFVADEVGMTKSALSNLERGNTRPRRTTRLLLLQFLEKRGYKAA